MARFDNDSDSAVLCCACGRHCWQEYHVRLESLYMSILCEVWTGMEHMGKAGFASLIGCELMWLDWSWSLLGPLVSRVG